MSFPTTNHLPENESTAAAPAVVGFMLGQLFGKAPPPPAALPLIAELEDQGGSDTADEGSGARSMGSRAAENAILRKIVGKRFIWAREACGLGQNDAALSLGWSNSTQLSLIERADRLPPHAVLLRAVQIYGISADFLLGMSDEPERDSFQASRNGALRRMQGLLEANARAVTEALLGAIRGDTSAELRSIRFVTEIEALLDGVDAFQAANADLFDDARGGATLVRRAVDAREALAKVVALMQSIDNRAAYAVQRARGGVIEPISGHDASEEGLAHEQSDR